MKSENEPVKKEVRYFNDDQVGTIRWMIRDFDEWAPENQYKKLANDRGIDISKVEEDLKRLERIGNCDRTKAVTTVVKIAVSNNEAGSDIIPEAPMSELTRLESILGHEFVIGSTKSEICKNMNLQLDQIKTISRSLLKKFNTKSRYGYVAWYTLQHPKS